MADDSTPNANPYIDPENLAFEQAFGAILGGKQLTDVSIADARKALDKVQTHRANPDISTAHFLVPTCHGPVKTFLYTPKGASANLPLIVHLHGGGFIIGDVFSYEPFVFDLVLRTKMAVALPEYTLAPQRKFPVQHEQCLEVVQYLVKHGSRKGLDTGKIAITSDSAGGKYSTNYPSASSLTAPLANSLSQFRF